jgi:indolepyruvate ferredoxin oxidoreductase
MNLNDKYTLEEGRVYLTGIQALVRLPIDQMRRDHRAGLNTGTFISGYEGSPLGGYDLALQRIQSILSAHRIHFQPGVNEDLAATAIYGTQIIEQLGADKTVDGVIGIWFGKGPGVDRSGDIFRHANLSGTGPNCGALVLAGDDHSCKSSTIPHQSDISLYNAGMPYLYPSNSQEVIDYGLYALAMSRFSGAWVGMKCVTEICDGGGTVDVHPSLPNVIIPEGYEKKWDARLSMPFSVALEYETNSRRLDAVRTFLRLNKLNRWRGASASQSPWFGILSAGKAYLDAVQALRDLGIHEEDYAALGIRVGKLAAPFPVEPDFIRDFASGLQLMLVVEEKKSFVEMQVKDILYGLTQRPAIIGKHDLEGLPLIPAHGETTPELLSKILFGILGAKLRNPEAAERRVAKIDTGMSVVKDWATVRPPNFCSGCPHNRSTILLEGQVAGGGIGCHTMAIRLPDRQFSFMTHMGAEGTPWIGMSKFSKREHVFQNIGDGTFFHSGSLAVEACVAAGVNITYKILYNGHVAMTGGQHAEGALPIPQLTKKLEAEGVRKIVVLAEDVTRYEGVILASNCELRDRSELPRTLSELEKVKGVTAIIYDQECAAEKRRKRSRGKLAEPTKRLVIHEEVCEGCGDCVKQSNCMSLMPVATELGQKMKIHQSSCNKDYTCSLGDCPSFVTINIKQGSGLKKRTIPKLPPAEVGKPAQMAPIGPDGYRILAPGIGGTGVVTVNALLATAAWIDGLSVITLDQTGSAQKGGAVVSHLLISEKPIEAPARINWGNADVVLGFDVMGVASTDNLKCLSPDKTSVVLNTSLVPTVDHIRNRVIMGPELMIDKIDKASKGRGHNIFVDANRLAEALFGSHLAVNIFLTGVAWQAGLIPISLAALEEAVQLNGVDIEKNLQVFSWGRKYYSDAKWVDSHVQQQQQQAPEKPNLDRVAKLEQYQNAQYANKFREFVDDIARKAPALRDAVERNLYKLMAIKDEYEVARLLTDPAFEEQVRGMWQEPESIGYNLHPPLLRQFGFHKKIQMGAWAKPFLKILASLKALRGGPLDVFGYSAHRRMERSLIGWYQDLVQSTLQRLTPDNVKVALEIVSIPDQIRGYEQIKEANVAKAKKLAIEKLAELDQLARAGVAGAKSSAAELMQ